GPRSDPRPASWTAVRRLRRDGHLPAPRPGLEHEDDRADPARRRAAVRRLRRGPLAHVVFPIACNLVGRIVSSGTNARGGRFTANTHAAATSSGISIWSRSSRGGGSGRRSRISVSTTPGRITVERI